MEPKVLKDLSAFAEYLRANPGLSLKVLAAAGRMKVVGAVNLRGEILAKFAGYSPKEG